MESKIRQDIAKSYTTMNNAMLNRAAILAFLLLCAGAIAHAQQPVESWSEAFAPPGVSGPVGAIAESNGRIYVSGFFFEAGPLHVQHLAAFDTATQTWLSVGDIGDGEVRALAAAETGVIYAAGTFTSVDGVPVSNIARYDPTSDAWFALGSGINGTIQALAVSPSGDLYAGGSFTSAGGASAQRIARWDGEQWHALEGNGIPSGEVWQMVFDGDVLYVSGRFDTAGGIASQNVAAYDTGTMTWKGLGGGVGRDFGTPYVSGIAISESQVYVGGYFQWAAQPDETTLPARNVARWDPIAEQWSALGDGLDYVGALGSGPDGAVYVNGDGDGLTGVLQRWNGTGWDAIVPREASLSSERPASVLFATENRLVVGFALFFVNGEGGGGQKQTLYWYEPDTDAWGVYGGPATQGMTDDVYAVTPGAAPGTAFAGGRFRFAGTELVEGVAYWNGATWEPLGQGVRMDSETAMGSVHALLRAEDGLIYVGGRFDEVVQSDGTVVASRNVAAWDPASGLWQALGQGAQAPSGPTVLPPVMALAQLPDGTIYVGGRITQAMQADGESLDVPRLAVWNPAEGQWESIPGHHGLGFVMSMAVGGSGALYAGGTASGGARLARLDPQTQAWSEQRVWPSTGWSTVNAVAATENDAVFVALDSGSVWLGQVGIWSEVRSFDYASAQALALNGDPLAGGELYVGARGAWRFRDGMWQEISEGGGTYALAVGLSETEGQAAVWVGGGFTRAGDLPSVGFARWEAARFGTSNEEDSSQASAVRLAVYPNPTTTSLTIDYALDAPASLRLVVYDLLGRERAVLHEGTVPAGPGALTADVAALPSGVYVLRMTTDDGRLNSSQRFTIVR